MIGRTFSIWLEMALSLQWIPLWALCRTFLLTLGIQNRRKGFRLSIFEGKAKLFGERG